MKFKPFLLLILVVGGFYGLMLNAAGQVISLPKEAEGLSEAEKKQIEFRERELQLKRDEISLKRAELSIWRNPLFYAIAAALIAALGNIGVAFWNGRQQRHLEAQKAEDARILKMIETDDADKAADNLQFLIDSGLVADSERVVKLGRYLDGRKSGQGPFLPVSGKPSLTIQESDTVPIQILDEAHPIAVAAKSIGVIQPFKTGAARKYTLAALVDRNIALVSMPAIYDADSAVLEIYQGEVVTKFEVELPPVHQFKYFALVRIKGDPSLKSGFLRISSEQPQIDQEIDVVLLDDGKTLRTFGDGPTQINSVAPDILAINKRAGKAGSVYLSKGMLIGFNLGMGSNSRVEELKRELVAAQEKIEAE